MSHIAPIYLWAAVSVFIASTIVSVAIFVKTRRVVLGRPAVAAGNGSGPDPTQSVFATGTLLAACATLWAAGATAAVAILQLGVALVPPATP